MTKLILLALAVALLSFSSSFAQVAPPSDLRQLADAIQRATKPLTGLKPYSTIGPSAAARSGVNMRAAAEWEIPLLLNDRTVPFDSLNRYTLQNVEFIVLDKSRATTSLFGPTGAWGVIRVNLTAYKPKRRKWRY